MSEIIDKATQAGKHLLIWDREKREEYYIHPSKVTVDSDTQMFLIEEGLKRVLDLHGFGLYNLEWIKYQRIILNTCLPCKVCEVRITNKAPSWVGRDIEFAILRAKRRNKIRHKKDIFFRIGTALRKGGYAARGDRRDKFVKRRKDNGCGNKDRLFRALRAR